MIHHDLGWEKDETEIDDLFITDSLIASAIHELRNFLVNCSEDKDTLDKMEQELDELDKLRMRIINRKEDERESSIDSYID